LALSALNYKRAMSVARMSEERTPLIAAVSHDHVHRQVTKTHLARELAQ
jgi:hypothetical protein